jgi:hypothetical protein
MRTDEGTRVQSHLIAKRSESGPCETSESLNPQLVTSYA